MESIHNDYLDKNVEVWSISPFDSIPALQSFKEENGFTYIMGGIEGGGQEIIEIYSDSLNLQYYPTISVICSNGELCWDIWPYTSDGAPEWRGPIEDCGVYDINVTSMTEDVLNSHPSSIFPNPVKEIINIEFYTEDIAVVLAEVYDITGRQILQKEIPINTLGQQTKQLEINKLATGSYFLRLTQHGNPLTILPFQK